jgi:Domain of unknown function (DUF1883)
MEYLHKELDLSQGDIVEVIWQGNPANIQLLDPSNYHAYRDRQPYRYYGGHATSSPFQLEVPHTGLWHLVIDLGGDAGKVRASVRILCSTNP